MEAHSFEKRPMFHSCWSTLQTNSEIVINKIFRTVQTKSWSKVFFNILLIENEGHQ